jgi:mannose-1-phosphate guanylyltransferase
MRAILLAAGLGTRLRPITDTIPKCLVPINGKPLIDYWLEQLTKAGIEKFLINTHYLYEQVESHIEQSKFADVVDLVYEEELLLTGGTVIANKDFISDEPFMLVHADNLSICDYEDFISAHKNRPANTEITMMTYTTDDPKSCGVVKIDTSGIIQEFHEKVQNPPSTTANGAVYIVEASVVSYMERLKKVKVDFSVDVLPYYMGRIFTYYNDLYHRDIGNIRSYELAQIETNSLYRKTS